MNATSDPENPFVKNAAALIGTGDDGDASFLVSVACKLSQLKFNVQCILFQNSVLKASLNSKYSDEVNIYYLKYCSDISFPVKACPNPLSPDD